MNKETKFQVLTIKEGGEVSSNDMTDMMKSLSESDSSIDLSGGAKKLDDLEDVLISDGLENLQAILYDNSDGKFKNQYVLLTNLINGTPSDQNIIKWDAQSETFIPAPISDLTGLFIDGTTLSGENTEESPIGIHPDVINNINGKLDSKYALFRLAVGTDDVDDPPPLGNGELVYYTRQRLLGGVKVTEHLIRDEYGDETLIRSIQETL